MISLITNLRST